MLGDYTMFLQPVSVVRQGNENENETLIQKNVYFNKIIEIIPLNIEHEKWSLAQHKNGDPIIIIDNELQTLQPDFVVHEINTTDLNNIHLEKHAQIHIYNLKETVLEIELNEMLSPIENLNFKFSSFNEIIAAHGVNPNAFGNILVVNGSFTRSDDNQTTLFSGDFLSSETSSFNYGNVRMTQSQAEQIVGTNDWLKHKFNVVLTSINAKYHYEKWMIHISNSEFAGMITGHNFDLLIEKLNIVLPPDILTKTNIIPPFVINTKQHMKESIMTAHISTLNINKRNRDAIGDTVYFGLYPDDITAINVKFVLSCGNTEKIGLMCNCRRMENECCFKCGVGVDTWAQIPRIQFETNNGTKLYANPEMHYFIFSEANRPSLKNIYTSIVKQAMAQNIIIEENVISNFYLQVAQAQLNGKTLAFVVTKSKNRISFIRASKVVPNNFNTSNFIIPQWETSTKGLYYAH